MFFFPYLLIYANQHCNGFRSNLGPILQPPVTTPALWIFTTPREAWRVLKTKIFYSTLINALAYYNAVSCKLKSRRIGSGANPTIVSYNASAVKIYNAASILEPIFYKFNKCSSLLQRRRCKFGSRRIGSRKFWPAFFSLRSCGDESPILDRVNFGI
jgi:hypothetical protein